MARTNLEINMTSSTILFSSLTPLQKAEAASLFVDVYFGTLPQDYSYEVDAASGQLTGQRNPLLLAKVLGTDRIKNVMIEAGGKPIISESAASLFAQWALSDLEANAPAQVDAPLIHLEAIR